MDVIRIDVPAFIRLVELAREEIKNDADLHDMAEIVARLSQETVVTMQHYNEILDFIKQQGGESEPAAAEEPSKDDSDDEWLRKLGTMFNRR